MMRMVTMDIGLPPFVEFHSCPSERPCSLHPLYPGDGIAETRASVEGRLS